jgi:hypothetical protein
MKIKTVALLLLMTCGLVMANTITPQRLVLKNQFGEVSLNYVQGSFLPLPGTNLSMVLSVGVVTPTSATLAGYANTGSLYINRNPAQNNSAKLFMNVGTITTPSWQVVGP